jgi:hypothetical protein
VGKKTTMNEIVLCDKSECYGCKNGQYHVIQSKWNWKKRPCPFYRERSELAIEEMELYGERISKPWETGEE